MNFYTQIGIVVLALTIAGGAYMSSMFSDVVITRGSFQEMKVAYITVAGNYYDAWNHYKDLCLLVDKRKYMNETVNDNLPCVGIYYDDPKDVQDQSQLRCIIGIILKDEWEEKDMNDQLHYGLIKSVKDSIQVRYPQRTLLSISMAVKKVYPKISDYHKQMNLAQDDLTAIAEIYMMEKGSLIFLQGIGKYEGLLTEIPKSFDF